MASSVAIINAENGCPKKLTMLVNVVFAMICLLMSTSERVFSRIRNNGIPIKMAINRNDGGGCKLSLSEFSVIKS